MVSIVRAFYASKHVHSALMKVTQVAVCPSEASNERGRPALTPELLAASGARYSRNNEGLESILSKIDPDNLEKSVDSIFRMVDYGHQSIADMVPVAIFIDGISIQLAYFVWTLCPTAGGQESSTRYIKISVDGLVQPEVLGIPKELIPEWQELMEQCFEAYQSSLAIWAQLASETPTLMGIPQELLDDTSEQGERKVKRMKRNYAFDRGRYFLPVAAATNAMLIMSARGWVSLCQHLLSHQLPEHRQLGELIRTELEIAAPRMTKHAQATESHHRASKQEFMKLEKSARNDPPFWNDSAWKSAIAILDVMTPDGVSGQEMREDLAYHSNRYAPVGSSLQRTSVRFGWSAIGFAEIRDLNRHRTGNKYCPQIPKGFYFALDQLPGNSTGNGLKSRLHDLSNIGIAASRKAYELLQREDPAYVYWALLGTEYPFEHTTNADKFLYEIELRTGLGAHYRYAKHIKDVLRLWYQRFPETEEHVLEGSAEPE